MRYSIVQQARVWDGILGEQPFTDTAPEGEIIAMLDVRLPRLGNRGLDIGCGNGRHLVAGAQRGYEMTGVDVSWQAAGLASGALKRAGQSPRVAIASMDRLPFPDSSFDFSMSWCVMNHGTQEIFTRAVRESFRVVRPHGYAFGLVMSPKDPRSGSGLDAGSETRVFTSGPERGVFHHFPREGHLRALLEEHGVIERFEELIESGEDLRRYHPDAHHAAHYWYVVRRELGEMAAQQPVAADGPLRGPPLNRTVGRRG